MANKKIDSQVLIWFKQPSSWISLTGLVISIITFFLVYAYTGSVKVVLPDRIGVATEKTGFLDMSIPLVFANTGSPRTIHNIQRITACVKYRRPDTNKENIIKLIWFHEHSFLADYQFENKYPHYSRTIDSTATDVMDWVNRAFPFAINGGSFVQKTYRFTTLKNEFNDMDLNQFELRIFVKAGKRGKRTFKSQWKNYNDISNSAIQKNYNWNFWRADLNIQNTGSK